MVGGLAWAVPPLLVFALPAVAFPGRDRGEAAYRHSPVLAGIVAPGGVCLIAATWETSMPHLPWVRRFAFVSAVHLGCVLTRSAAANRERVAATVLAAVSALVCVPLCEPDASPEVTGLAALLAALGTAAFAACLPSLRARVGPGPAPAVRLATAVALLLSAGPAHAWGHRPPGDHGQWFKPKQAGSPRNPETRRSRRCFGTWDQTVSSTDDGESGRIGMAPSERLLRSRSGLRGSPALPDLGQPSVAVAGGEPAPRVAHRPRRFGRPEHRHSDSQWPSLAYPGSTA